MGNLRTQHCKSCEGGVDPLSAEDVQLLLQQLDDAWLVSDDGGNITREFEFLNYYQTTAFVNAVAWIAHTQDHHPDMTFGYKQCTVLYSTHAINGLSENDFICAARIDALLETD